MELIRWDKTNKKQFQMDLFELVQPITKSAELKFYWSSRHALSYMNLVIVIRKIKLTGIERKQPNENGPALKGKTKDKRRNFLRKKQILFSLGKFDNFFRCIKHFNKKTRRKAIEKLECSNSIKHFEIKTSKRWRRMFLGKVNLELVEFA